MTQRQFIEAHAQNAACATCHAPMDAIGGAFEEFDAIGRYRTMDGKQPVNSSGQLTGTAHENGPLNSVVDLAGRLAAADEVRQCVVRQWFRFVFGRVEGTDDNGTIANATSPFKDSGYRIPDLLAAFTATRNFRYRTRVATQ
jgi:hypothetical protein